MRKMHLSIDRGPAFAYICPMQNAIFSVSYFYFYFHSQRAVKVAS